MLIDRRLSIKIPFHDQLADLRVQLRDLGIARRLRRHGPAGEALRHPLNSLALPGRDHGLMNAVLRHQL
jgi:hypothetical protein